MTNNKILTMHGRPLGEGEDGPPLWRADYELYWDRPRAETGRRPWVGIAGWEAWTDREPGYKLWLLSLPVDMLAAMRDGGTLSLAVKRNTPEAVLPVARHDVFFMVARWEQARPALVGQMEGARLVLESVPTDMLRVAEKFDMIELYAYPPSAEVTD